MIILGGKLADSSVTSYERVCHVSTLLEFTTVDVLTVIQNSNTNFKENFVSTGKNSKTFNIEVENIAR